MRRAGRRVNLGKATIARSSLLFFVLRSSFFALCSLLFQECALRAQGSPYAVSERGTRRPAGELAWMPIPFRQGRSPVEKPGRLSRLGGRSPQSTASGCPFFGLLFLTSGIHALRPSGQLRCSHTLLRVRGHAKKSDSGLGRGMKRPPRRRATWR
jgi:hypothetical protein